MMRSRSWLYAAALIGSLVWGALPAHAATTGLVNVTANRVLRDNHYGTFRIMASNITLDCNGYQIDFHPDVQKICGPNGNQSCAVSVNGFNNVTIKNCGMLSFLDYGVWMTNSSNSQVVWSYSYARTGYRFQNTTNTYLFAVDSLYNSLGGHEYRNTTRLIAEECWASNATGDGFDDNNGIQTDFDQVWSHDNGVNGLECDDCDAPWYFDGVNSEWNGQHGISLDQSPGFSIDESFFNSNGQDGIRVQSSSNDGDVTDNDAFDSGSGCDLRQSGTSGNFWSGNSYGTRCGTVPAH